MIALIAIATVELCPVGDPLAEIQEMIIRPSAARWEQERTFQVLAGKQTFQRFHQAIWNRNLALLPILGDEAPLRLPATLTTCSFRSRSARVTCRTSASRNPVIQKNSNSTRSNESQAARNCSTSSAR